MYKINSKIKKIIPCVFFVLFFILASLLINNFFSNIKQTYAVSGTTDLAILINGPINSYNGYDFIYDIVVSNNGPDPAPGSLFSHTLFDGATNVSFSCESTSGDAVCPTLTGNNKTITGTIDTFPANSSVSLQVKGRFPFLKAPTSLSTTAEVKVPDGMSEIDANTNTTITNTQITTLPADTAVTDFSQSTTGSIASEVIPNPDNFSEDLIITDQTPISFSITYSNLGTGYADGARAAFDLSGTNFLLEYTNFSISCTETGGAVCPSTYNSSFNQVTGSGNFNIGNSVSAIYAYIPYFPPSSSITYNVSFKPTKATSYYTRCGSAIKDIEISPIRASISNPNGISEFDSSNNSYYSLTNIAKIASSPIGNISFGTIHQINCPETDTAVIDYTQSITGTILSHTIPNPTNEFTQDLIIDNQTPITFSTTYKNLGSGSADNASFFFNVRGTSYNLQYSDFKIICTASGGAECPSTYTSKFDFNTGSGTVYLDLLNSSLISGNIPIFPAGSSVNFHISFKPLKASFSYSKCGSDSQQITIGPFFTRVNNPTGINDPNTVNNSYGNGSSLDPIASTAYGTIDFGTIKQTLCPETDTAVTDFFQSVTGNILSTNIPNPDNYGEDIIIEDKTPLRFSTTYSNLGSGSADGARIFYTLGAALGNSFTLHYSDFKIICTASGGAECPISPASGFDTNIGSGSVTFSNAAPYLIAGAFIPTLPAGSSVKFDFSFIPQKITYAYNSCGIGSVNALLRAYNISISNPQGVTETDRTNNSYLNSTLYNIASSPVGNIGFGTITRQACVPTDLTSSMTSSSDIIWFDIPYTHTFTYTNNGSEIVYGADIEGSKHNGYLTSINYKDYTITCNASSGSICPESFGGNISQTGIFLNNQTNYFIRTKAPRLLPGGSLTFNISYTPTKFSQTNPTCSASVEKLTYSTFYSKITATPAYTETNTSNNNSSFISNNIYCVDLYVKNTPSVPNPAPNEAFTIALQIGNAGAATATGVKLQTIIPSGFTGFTIDNITCSNIGNSDCGEYSFDPITRSFIAQISSISKDAATIYNLYGSAINYSSSWWSDTYGTLSPGYYERIPDTNTARTSFTVQGNDPTVTKTIDLKDAYPGDLVNYTIYVRNPSSGATLYNSTIKDILPIGLSYVKTNNITLNLASQSGELVENNPNEPIVQTNSSGAVEITWGKYEVSPSGFISVDFQARINTIVPCKKSPHDNSGYFTYTFSGGLTDTRFYDGTLIGFDQDDVIITCTPLITNDDNFYSTDVNGSGDLNPGGVLSITGNNVLTNDSFSGQSINLDLVNINFSKNPVMTGSSTNSGELVALPYPDGINLSSTGYLSWPDYIEGGTYYVEYSLCEKANYYNCSKSVVKISIDRLNSRQGSISPKEDTINITHDSKGIFIGKTSPKSIDILSNDTYTIPSNPFVEIPASYDTTTFNLTGTFVENNTINSGHLLAGSNLSSSGIFTLASTSATGTFNLAYQICTKETATITSICALSNIIININGIPQATYKVSHYLENDDSEFLIDYSKEEIHTGNIDLEVSATPLIFSGYTFDQSITGSLLTGAISLDNSLNLKVYYKKNTIPQTEASYTIYHYLDDGNFNFNLDSSKTQNLTGIVGALVSANSLNIENYSFDSSIPGTYLSGKILEDNSLKLHLYYTKNTQTSTGNIDTNTGSTSSGTTNTGSTSTGETNSGSTNINTGATNTGIIIPPIGTGSSSSPTTGTTPIIPSTPTNITPSDKPETTNNQVTTNTGTQSNTGNTQTGIIDNESIPELNSAEEISADFYDPKFNFEDIPPLETPPTKIEINQVEPDDSKKSTTKTSIKVDEKTSVKQIDNSKIPQIDSINLKDKFSINKHIKRIGIDGDFLFYNDKIPQTGEVPLSLFKKYDGESLIKGIDPNYPHYEALIGMYKFGIMGDSGLENINPEAKITKAELSKIILLANKTKIEEKNLENIVFQDVKQSDWFAKYAYTITKNNIITGTEEEKFGPGENIKYKDFAKIIVKGFNLNEEKQNLSSIEILNKNGLLNSKNLDTEKEISRGEVASVIYKAMIKNSQSQKIYEDNIKLDIDKLNIHISPNRTLLEDASVRLKDLSESGGGFYDDKIRERIIILGHSSVRPDDKNPHGAVFKKFIGGKKDGTKIKITRNNEEKEYEIFSGIKISEKDISKLKDDAPDGTKIIIFTCDKDLRYRWVYYAK